MASKAAKMPVLVNMRIDTRVIKFTDFISEIRNDLRGHLEVAMASKAAKMPV